MSHNLRFSACSTQKKFLCIYIYIHTYTDVYVYISTDFKPAAAALDLLQCVQERSLTFSCRKTSCQQDLQNRAALSPYPYVAGSAANPEESWANSCAVHDPSFWVQSLIHLMPHTSHNTTCVFVCSFLMGKTLESFTLELTWGSGMGSQDSGFSPHFFALLRLSPAPWQIRRRFGLSTWLSHDRS